MIAIVLRIVLGLLAAGFIAWYLYITWLGLKTFFGLESDDINLEKLEKLEKPAPAQNAK